MKSGAGAALRSPAKGPGSYPAVGFPFRKPEKEEPDESRPLMRRIRTGKNLERQTLVELHHKYSLTSPPICQLVPGEDMGASEVETNGNGAIRHLKELRHESEPDKKRCENYGYQQASRIPQRPPLPAIVSLKKVGCERHPKASCQNYSRCSPKAWNEPHHRALTTLPHAQSHDTKTPPASSPPDHKRCADPPALSPASPRAAGQGRARGIRSTR